MFCYENQIWKKYTTKVKWHLLAISLAPFMWRNWFECSPFFSSELLRFSFSWYYFFPTSHISFKYSNWICRNIFCSFQSKKIWPTKFLFLVGMNGSVFFAIPNFLSSRNAWYSKVSVESMLYLCTYISYWNMIFIGCLSNIQNMQ